MTSHRAWLLAALLALTVSPAQAQNPSGRGTGRRMQLLFRDITLTEDQQTKVDSIQSRYRAQMPSFTPGTPPDSATRQKIRGLFRHEIDDLRAVLTADQQKAFDKNLAEMRQGRRGGR
jgi:Spy/CpxP family protein refolding chaperone